jgi:hypothetical protein
MVEALFERFPDCLRNRIQGLAQYTSEFKDILDREVMTEGALRNVGRFQDLVDPSPARRRDLAPQPDPGAARPAVAAAP